MEAPPLLSQSVASSNTLPPAATVTAPTLATNDISATVPFIVSQPQLPSTVSSFSPTTFSTQPLLLLHSQPPPLIVSPTHDNESIIVTNPCISLVSIAHSTRNRVLSSRLSFVAHSDEDDNDNDDNDSIHNRAESRYYSSRYTHSHNSLDSNITYPSIITHDNSRITRDYHTPIMLTSEDNTANEHGMYLDTSMSQTSGNNHGKPGEPAGSGAISVRAVGRRSHDTDNNTIHSLIAHPTTGQDNRVGAVSNKRSSALIPVAADFNMNSTDADEHNGTRDVVASTLESTEHNKETMTTDELTTTNPHRRYSHTNAKSMQPAATVTTAGTSPSSALAEPDANDPGNSTLISENAYSDIRMAYTSPVNSSATDTDIQLQSKVDRYGFIHGNEEEDDDDDETFAMNAVQTPAEKRRESNRALKWMRMATKRWSSTTSSLYSFRLSSKFKLRVFKGIPDCWRAEAWHFMLTTGNSTSMSEEAIAASYQVLLRQTSPHEHQIDIDIERTIRSHVMFSQRYGPGQRHLFNILCAYSNAVPDVGYCQGMATIAAILLLYFDEERAFIIMRMLFAKHNLEKLFQPGFPALMEAIFVQGHLLESCSPKLAKHLAAIGVMPEMYSIKWYCTLFSNGVMPHRTTLRVWDLLMLEGFDALICVTTGLLLHFQDQLLQGNFEMVVQFLNNTLPFDSEQSEDTFFLGIVRRLLEQRKYITMRRRLHNEY